MKVKATSGMKRSRIPWAMKLRPDMEPRVVPDPKGRGRMLLPTPLLVAREISLIEKGAVLTASELRSRLAQRFQANLTCPLMTGIFYNIVAGAAEDQLAAQREPMAPYWRVVSEKGGLSPKSPPGPKRQAEHLRSEGHRIQTKRGKLFVAGFSREPAAH